MNELVHTYGGNPLDRGEPLRREEATIERLRTAASARCLVFHKLRVGVHADHNLSWLSPIETAAEQTGLTLFLGEHDGVPHFALEWLDEVAPPGIDEFADCRLLAAHLTTPETGILAQARAQLDWHRRNPFCAQCGAESHPERGGQIRRCDACEKHIFPRTDPVAIMLIVDEAGGEHCLLGKSQGRMARGNFYSCLAGFIDQGESLEAAVRREVWEEAGIRVGPVFYHSSQPWPFPSQLMIGCHGIATHKDINFDSAEMADVRWFHRDEAAAALRQENNSLNVPGQMAIAHHLIRTWVEGEIQL
ncbi:MAG: NAD(+) diphosphatase [Pseudomonadota bacterium]